MISEEFSNQLALYKNDLENKEKSDQEKYIICLKIWELHEKYNMQENAITYIIESYYYDKTRIEGIYQLIKHFCCTGKNEIAFSFYTLIQEYYENEYLQEPPEKMNSRLYPNVLEYDFYLPYFMIIVCEKLKKYDICIKMYEIIFHKKPLQINSWWLNCLFINLQFVINNVRTPIFFRQCETYLNLLYLHHSNINFIETKHLLKLVNNGINSINKNNLIFSDKLQEKKKTFIIDRTIQSNKILIYTGFNYFNWNSTYGKHNYLGGSERAVDFVSQHFPKDMQIYISGSTIEEKFDNIQYIYLDNLHDFMKHNEFHAIIISRYIGFFEMYNYFKTKQLIAWSHDINFLPYNSVNKLDSHTIIEKWHGLIDKCICLTEWHKELYVKKYPLLADKIHILGNGIQFDLFPKEIQDNNPLVVSEKRKKNRFIYSSNPNRGLSRILELWEGILEIFPDAELAIVCQEPDEEQKRLIQKYPSINYLGSCEPKRIYDDKRYMVLSGHEF